MSLTSNNYTTLLISLQGAAYVSGHWPEFFDDPDTFDPDRFDPHNPKYVSMRVQWNLQ